MIFVFGSNESGIHGAGAAAHAMKHEGAEFGLGFGRSGNSFAIPTKDWDINTLPITTIGFYVKRFIAYARLHPELEFDVTRIGCGLAGYTDEDIAPLFRTAPDNCKLPEEPKVWREIADKA